MIKNYIKVAIRNILKNKVFSFINIFGLAASMAICLVVIMMVSDQLSYDRHNSKQDRIYRVVVQELDDDFPFRRATTPLPLAKALKEEFTGVEKVVRIRRGFGNGWVKIDQDVNIPVGGFFVDPDFLDLFEYNLAYGDRSSALTEPNAMVVTEETALRLYGKTDVVGKIITVGELGDYKITGVLEETTDKSHIKFEALASMATVKLLEADSVLSPSLDKWNNTSFGWNYLLLANGTSPADVERHLTTLNEQHYTEEDDANLEFFLQNLTDINPGPMMGNQIGPGMPDIVVYFLAGLALIIMLSACFNYTNLSIARALTRAREVGIRKVSGAFRRQVFFQFLSEAVIMSLLALALSFAFLVFLKPAFQHLKLAQFLEWDLGANVYTYLTCLVFALFVGLMAGFFPALLLSRFQPIKVLKDLSGIRLFSKIGLRKGLLVAQFTLSLVFIISVTLVYQQMKMMMSANYGFESSQIVNLKLHDTDYKALKNELSQYTSIENIAASSHIPAAGISSSTTIKANLEAEEESINYFSVDEHYIDNMGINLVAGKNFHAENDKANESLIIINEEAVGHFEFSDINAALGEVVYTNDSSTMQIIGVVEDYNHEALMVEIAPLILRFSPERYTQLQIKVQGDPATALADIKSAWIKVEPEKQIDYKFMDEEIKEFYEILLSDIVNIVFLISTLAIIIACLGLLGMAIFTTETRQKEVSIRKVLGASEKVIALLLSRGFLALLLIAIVISVPAAYFLNSLWLQFFAYHIEITFSTILLGVLITALLGLVTIGSQTIRASLANPIESLRKD
ncbi:MAG: ABC transporter permease [Bacteroidota bacterium]